MWVIGMHLLTYKFNCFYGSQCRSHATVMLTCFCVRVCVCVYTCVSRFPEASEVDQSQSSHLEICGLFQVSFLVGRSQKSFYRRLHILSSVQSTWCLQLLGYCCCVISCSITVGYYRHLVLPKIPDTLQKPAPEIGTLNSMPDSGASFSCRCTASNIIDCLRTLKAVNDVRSHASARKTGARIWRRIQAHGTDFWSRFLECVSGAQDLYNVLIVLSLVTN